MSMYLDMCLILLLHFPCKALLRMVLGAVADAGAETGAGAGAVAGLGAGAGAGALLCTCYIDAVFQPKSEKLGCLRYFLW